MASSFKNAHTAVGTSDTDLYVANQVNQLSAVVHGLYLANTDATANVAVTVKVYDDSSAASRVIANAVPVPANSTMTLDKPLNLEPNDKIVVFASSTNCEAFASVLELFP